MSSKLEEQKKIWDQKLQIEKDKLRSGGVADSEKLQSVINEAHALVKNDFSGFDPIFSFGILCQLESLKGGKLDDVDDAMKLLFERSILKTVTPGNLTEMLLVTQMISVHNAMMDIARLLAQSKRTDEIERYGNMLNKFARTFYL